MLVVNFDEWIELCKWCTANHILIVCDTRHNETKILRDL